MNKYILYPALLLLSFHKPKAQELQAKVTVLFNQIPNSVSRSVFQTLQTGLTNFLNNRKWSQDNFQPQERIDCNFILNLTQLLETNVFQATLTVQAGRPVYNSNYVSPMVTYQDANIVFRYTEFQPLEFNENRITGTDALASNLTAVFAYYVNVILGFDYDSFSVRGGDPYFQKAMNIVNAAPDGRNITGWKPFDGQRNRYWLMENVTNNKYAIIHDALYSYYRRGMDNFYENDRKARTEILNAFIYLDNLNRDNPSSMIVPFFFQSRADEIVNMFKKAPPSEKLRASELLQRLDISNASRYKQELK